MMSDKQTYLGKGGKHYGPFSDAEIEAFRRSGELENYAFIWDAFYRRWDALHAAPAPIPAASASAAKSAGASAVFAERMEAVCHDSLHILNGHLEDVSGQGCVLVSRGGHHRPFFGENARVKVDVLSPRSGKSATLVARLGKVSRGAHGALSYELLWERPAEVLLQF